jgi:hypothetical protein
MLKAALDEGQATAEQAAGGPADKAPILLDKELIAA